MIGPAVGFESLQACWVCIPAGIRMSRMTSIIRFDTPIVLHGRTLFDAHK